MSIDAIRSLLMLDIGCAEFVKRVLASSVGLSVKESAGVKATNS
jgi:hypothetical protein